MLAWHFEDFERAKGWPRPKFPFKYISKKRELRLILKPTDRIIDDQRRVIPIQGVKAEFVNGEFFTDDPVIICALRNHPMKDAHYVCCDDDKTYVETEGKMIVELPRVKTPDELKSPPILMTTGANSTTSALAQAAKDEEAAELIETMAKATAEPQLSREDVIKIIDDRLADAIGKIAGIVENAQAKAVSKGPKKFTCKVCHTPLPSGIAVGKHMKEAHPNVVSK